MADSPQQLPNKTRLFTSEGVVRWITLALVAIHFFLIVSADKAYLDHFDAFKFGLASSIIALCWILFILFAYSVEFKLPAYFEHMPRTELIGDGVVLVLEFFAGIFVAGKCEEKIATIKICSPDEGKQVAASAAFSFLVAAALAVSFYFDWKVCFKIGRNRLLTLLHAGERSTGAGPKE